MDGSLRLLCGISVLMLHFQAIEPGIIENTIKDVMKKNGLCDASIGQSLIESDFAKECGSLTYPFVMEKLNFQENTTNTFLCLNVYDALYKVCYYMKEKQWINPFKNKKEFDEMIQQFISQESNNVTSFCNNLKEYSPMYDETKPALLKLADMLKQQSKCLRICFDLYDRLNPLCAILAWIRSVDKKVGNTTTPIKTVPIKTVPVKTVPIASDIKSQKVPSALDVQPVQKDDHHPNVVQSSVKHVPAITEKSNIASTSKEKKEKAERNHKDVNEIVNNSHNSISNNSVVANVEKQNVPLKDNHNKPLDLFDAEGSESKTKLKDTAKVTKTDPVVPDSKDNDKPKEANVHDHIKVPSNKLSTPEKSVNIDSIQENHQDKAVANPSEDETKSSTLSEHTQDIVGNVRQSNGDSEDYNHLDENHPHYVNGDAMDQPPDIDNRNIALPSEQGDIIPHFRASTDDEESHFFTYFASLFLICIAGYIGYHNKQKILAIVLEGRRTRNNRARRRPSTANYRKLDCTLEEAITSQCNANVTHVIY